MTNKRNTGQGKQLIVHIIIALICAFFVAAAIIGFFSYLMCNIDIPLFMAVPFATIAASLAALISGAILSYAENGKGVIFGIASGLVLFLVFWLCNFINGDVGLTSLAVLKLIAFCAAGCIGGILGAFLKDKKLRHHH